MKRVLLLLTLGALAAAVETQPLPPQWDFAANVLTAADKVNALQLTASQANIVATINSLISDLSVSLRADNQIKDQAVKLWTLGPDVLSVMGSPSGWQPKASADASTTGALPTNTYAAGVLTATSNGALPAQDGQVLTAGQTLLVQNEVAQANNGIYLVTQVGSGSLPYILTRRSDANTAASLGYAFLYVTAGGADGGIEFICNVPPTQLTLGTTPITWQPFGRSFGPGVLPVLSGGTGSTTAAGARASLGISSAMDPVVTAASTPAAIAAMGPWGSALATSTKGSAARTIADLQANVYNVKNYGAVGTAAADDTAAINAALTAIGNAPFGGTLYFPSGIYLVTSPITYSGSNPIWIVGDGGQTSRIAANFASGDVLTISNAGGVCGVQNMAFIPTVPRNTGSYQLTLSSVTRGWVLSDYFNCSGGSLVHLNGVNFATMDQCQGDSSTGSNGDTALRVDASGGSWTNNIFRLGGPNNGVSNGPCVYVTGTATSMFWANNLFGGGGPRNRYAVSSIVSGPSNFTATTATAHAFKAGDYVVFRNMTPSAYNNLWRINSVTSSTIVVNTSINPGTSTVNGQAESRSSCMYISNEGGAINESSITGQICGAGASRVYGTCSILLDGNRGAAGAQNTLSGWSLTNLYLEYGSEGIGLIGGDASGAGAPTLFGIAIANVNLQAQTRGIFVSQAAGVTISGVDCSIPAGAAAADSLATGTSGLHVFAGLAAPFTRGITVSNSQLGTTRDFQDGNFASGGAAFGVLLDSPGIQDLTITGSSIYGSTAAFGEVNGPEAAGQRWKFVGNSLTTGSTPFTANSTLPSIASATSTALLPGFDIQKVTGTTTISTITGGWVGREVTLLFPSALTLGTGGNLAIAANYSVLAGQRVSLSFDGTSWFLK